MWNGFNILVDFIGFMKTVSYNRQQWKRETVSLLYLTVNASSYVCTLLSCLWKYHAWIENVFLFNARAYMHIYNLCVCAVHVYICT